MFSLRSMATLLLGLSLAACGEEGADPLVNDTISWQVGCASAGCVSFNAHSQEAAEEKFSVRCKKTSIGLSVTITDPGSVEANRTRGTLRIDNLNPKTGDCTVTVSDSATLRDNEQRFMGTCADQDCRITGGPANGWDFEGTIICDSLEVPNTAGGVIYTLNKANSKEPVQLAVDNCE